MKINKTAVFTELDDLSSLVGTVVTSVTQNGDDNGFEIEFESEASNGTISQKLRYTPGCEDGEMWLSLPIITSVSESID